MSTPTPAAELLKGDLSGHTPMMAQYLGANFSTNAGTAFKVIFLATVPS